MAERRTKLIKCYVSTSEFQTIQTYAREANQTIAAYGRQQMLLHTPVDLSSLAEARELRSLGLMMRENLREESPNSVEILKTLTLVKLKLMEKSR